MTNEVNKIISLMHDNRLAISFYSNPIPEFKEWLFKNVDYIYAFNFNQINKEIDLFKKSVSDLNLAFDFCSNNKKLIELYLSECYYFHQKYFFYNEVFNYGFFGDELINKIKNKKLNVDDTLLCLVNYENSLFYEIYKDIGELIKISAITCVDDLIKLKSNKKANKIIVNILKKYSKNSYSEKNLTDIFNLVVSYKRISVFKKKIPKDLVEFYHFIVNNQKKLFEIHVIIRKIYDKIYFQYPDLKKKYNSQKSNLFSYYLNNKINLNKYKLSEGIVYYKKHLFSIKTGKVFKLNKDYNLFFEVLFNKKENNISQIFINKTVTDLLNKQFLVLKNKKYPVTFYRFFFEVTNNCDLNCRYCFNKNISRYFELKTKDWMYISENLPENTQLTLFGGEPFLKDNIEELINKLDLLLSSNKLLEVRCFTNGINTDKILNILSKLKNKFIILISLDGLKKENDLIRGKGSYLKTIETIKRIKKETKHIVWVKTLMTTINYKKITTFYKYLDNLNVDYYSLGELHLKGNARNKQKELIDFKKEFNLFNQLNKIKTNKIKIKENNILSDFLVNRCGYGYNLVYIRSDGFITGCTEKNDYKNHIFELYPFMNNLKNDPIKYIPDLFKKGMIDLNGICNNCGLVNLCMGGCLARSENGSCDIYRKRKINFLLDLILKKNK